MLPTPHGGINFGHNIGTNLGAIEAIGAIGAIGALEPLLVSSIYKCGNQEGTVPPTP